MILPIVDMQTELFFDNIKRDKSQHKESIIGSFDKLGAIFQGVSTMRTENKKLNPESLRKMQLSIQNRTSNIE